jgi:hypothetical protein
MVRLLGFILLTHGHGGFQIVSYAECVLSGCWYQVTCLSHMDILHIFSTFIIVGKSVRKWIYLHSILIVVLTTVKLVLYNLSSWQSL